METLKMWMQEVDVEHGMSHDEPEIESDVQDEGVYDEAQVRNQPVDPSGIFRPTSESFFST